MAGLPNSSNALQQWHHLFEAQGGPVPPEASQHLQQLLRGRAADAQARGLEIHSAGCPT